MTHISDASIRVDGLGNKSRAPKLAHSIYRKALDYDVQLAFDDQNIVCAPFTDACFYPSNFTIYIHHQEDRYHIVVEGEAKAISNNEVLSSWEEFRAAYPDGIISDGELQSNSWFSLRHMDDDYPFYDAGAEEGFISHDIDDAVEMFFNYIDS